MKNILCFILLLPLFFVSAYAENVEGEFAEMTGIYDVQDALGDEEKKITGQLRLDGDLDVGGAFKRMLHSLKEKAVDGLRGELKFALAILAVSVLCALASSLCDEGNVSDYIQIAGCCAVAYMLSGTMDGIISQAINAINRLSDYSRAAMPAIFTAAAACGAVGSASVKYAGACMAMELFMTAARNLIIPLIYAYLAMSLSCAVFDNSILRAAAKFCKNIAVLVLTVISIGFSTYIGMSGLIAGSTDAMAVKTAKTVISNSLPVVGGIISDAASVVLASASLIKNSAGVFSLIAVCAMCAGPFAVLSVKMLLYKAVSAAAEMLPGSRISVLLNSMGNAAAMLLGLLGSCGIMLFISIMSGIKVVSL